MSKFSIPVPVLAALVAAGASGPVIQAPVYPGRFAGIHFRPDDTPPGSQTPPGTPPGTPPVDDDPLDTPVKLTQRELQALIERRDTNATSKAERKYKGELETLQKELEALKKAPKPAPKEGDPKTFTQEDIQTLISAKEEEHKAALKGYDTRLAVFQNTQKSNALITAAMEAKALDAAVVSKLVSEFVSIDDEGNTVVHDGKGKERLGANGKEMTVKELVEEFLVGHPYLKQGANNNGNGSNTNNGKKNEADSKLPPAVQLANAMRNISARK